VVGGVRKFLQVLVPCLFLFSCQRKEGDEDLRAAAIPPERISGMIVSKDEEQLFLTVEVTEIHLVLIDSLELDVGDTIFVHFDEVMRFDSVPENVDSLDLDSRRAELFATYSTGQEVVYYFRNNIPQGNVLTLKNDNDLRIVN
jgi:hypothetical protein